ncbi:MAG: DUF6263 family protein [Ferruginibacter sp.]
MKFFNLSLIFTLFSFVLNAQNFTDKVIVKKDQVIEVVANVNEVMNMGMEMITNSSITRNIKVAEVSESDFKIKVKITKFKNSGNAGGISANYDSEKPDSENSPELIETFKDKLNSEDEYLVNRNTVISTDLNKKDATENGPMDAITEAVGGTEAIASEIFFIIPKGTKVGASWSTSSETKGGKTEGRYTLKEVKGGVAYVDYNSVSTINLSFPYEGMEMKMDMKMTMSGNLIVNTETGIMQKKSTKGFSEGTMDMMGQTTPLTMNTTMESTYTIK